MNIGVEINEHYWSLVNAGFIHRPENLRVEEEKLSVLDMPHEYNPSQRVFEVIIRSGPLHQMQGFKFAIVANSFVQASAAAVDRANAMLDEYKKAQANGWVPVTDTETQLIDKFYPAHVTEMKVIVNDPVTIFRHERVAK